jgi:hypothetical protein
MKRSNTLAASAALILWCLAPSYGAPKSKAESPATEAEATLEQIDNWSAAIADAADYLHDIAQRRLDPQSHLEGLDLLREDINKIGTDLNVLGAERDALAAWEAKALDQIMPLMLDAADNADKAIQTYNSDRARLWATSYADETAKVSKDAGDVTALLRDYLKLKKTQEKELRIEQSLGEAGQH